MSKVQVLFFFLLLGLTFGRKISFDGSPSSGDNSSFGSVAYLNISLYEQARSIESTESQSSRNRIGEGPGDSAQIVFPQSQKVAVAHKKSSKDDTHWIFEIVFLSVDNEKVPLHVLKTLSSETDFAQIVRNFVTNVDIQKIQETGEQILVKSKGGVPIKDSRGQNIVVSTVPLVTRPSLTTQPASQFNQTISGSRTRVDEAVAGRMGPQTVTNNLSRFATRVAPEKPPEVAVCKPEVQTVQVPVTFDPHIIYYPRCVRVERCGGCCGSDILACEPSEITTVNVPVRKLEYIGDGNNTNLEFVEQVDVPMDKHTRCECRCRVKEQDCGVRQIYKEHECLCACRNEEAKERCLDDPQKTWDPIHCDCSCREIKDCNSGFLFDLQTCQCTPTPQRPKRQRATPKPGLKTYPSRHLMTASYSPQRFSN